MNSGQQLSSSVTKHYSDMKRYDQYSPLLQDYYIPTSSVVRERIGDPSLREAGTQILGSPANSNIDANLEEYSYNIGAAEQVDSGSNFLSKKLSSHAKYFTQTDDTQDCSGK